MCAQPFKRLDFPCLMCFFYSSIHMTVRRHVQTQYHTFTCGINLLAMIILRVHLLFAIVLHRTRNYFRIASVLETSARSNVTALIFNECYSCTQTVNIITEGSIQNITSSRISFKKNPMIMKIDTRQFHSLFTPEVDSLVKLFEKYGYELRIVGGAVRDLLIGQIPHDLDFATSANLQQMKEMFEREGVRMLTKGEKHGTIMIRINKVNFEVSTLRVDVKTDGHRAKIESTQKWELDALGRDLTINSMYLGLDGTVYDYCGGYEDLQNKRVVFIGNASQQIQKDYLIILRYFRFYGRIAQHPDSHDEETLKAIQQNAAGLEKIHGERIWLELQRIVIGNYAEELIKKILDIGLSPYIGLGAPEELDMKCFENTCRLKNKYSFKSITYIAALLPNKEKLLKFRSRCKLSANECDLARFIINYKCDNLTEPRENLLRRFRHVCVMAKSMKEKREQVREFILELFRFKDREDLTTAFASWIIPPSPIDGNQLRKKRNMTDNELSFALLKMRELWIESDFKLTENKLLEKLPDILDQLKNLQSKKKNT